jgi:flagellar basal body-associated protein FliL
MQLMKLSIRIPLGLTIAVVIIGIVAFLRISKNPGLFPTTYFIIWLVVSFILAGITIWSWMRNKISEQHEHDRSQESD